MSATVAIALLLFARPAQMQMQGHGTPAQNPPITLKTGLGPIHYKVSTKNETAQKFFDQGLALTFGFHHNQAIRSFEEAARLDPSLAMAQWGIAYAMGPNINMPIDADTNKQCYAIAKKAASLKGTASPNERALIDALLKRYSDEEKPDLQALNVAYANAMKEVAKMYLDDLDIQTLYAESMMDVRPWNYWTHDGKMNEGTQEILDTLNAVLAKNPEHIGANHYLIHALEASPNPERALEAANRLQTLAPESGHLVHMPSHIYIRTGDWAKGMESNEAALNTDKRFLDKTPSPGVYPMYYVHNFDMLRQAASMGGNYERSHWAAVNVAEKAATMGPMGEPLAAVPWLDDVRFRKWDAVRAYKLPTSSLPIVQGYYQFSQGMAMAATGDVASAEAARDKVKAELGKITPDMMWGLTPAGIPLEAALNLLEAAIARAKNDPDGEAKSLQKSIDLADTVNYNEPPDFFFPPRESLGGALLRAGKAAEAEAVFREDLRRNPGNGRSLFGLMKALESQGKDTGEVKKDFDKAWVKGDTTLRVEDL